MPHSPLANHSSKRVFTDHDLSLPRPGSRKAAKRLQWPSLAHPQRGTSTIPEVRWNRPRFLSRNEEVLMHFVLGGFIAAIPAGLIGGFLFDRGFVVAGWIFGGLTLVGLAPMALLVGGGAIVWILAWGLNLLAWALVAIWVGLSGLLWLFAGSNRKDFLDYAAEARRLVTKKLDWF